VLLQAFPLHYQFIQHFNNKIIRFKGVITVNQSVEAINFLHLAFFAF